VGTSDSIQFNSSIVCFKNYSLFPKNIYDIQTYFKDVGFQLPVAVTVKSTIIHDMALCSLLEVCQHFWEIHNFQIQDLKLSCVRKKQAYTRSYSADGCLLGSLFNSEDGCSTLNFVVSVCERTTLTE
jgi:hypothetical protein